MDIRDKTRERAELRIHAKETLDSIITWLSAVQPSMWLPGGKDSAISADEAKVEWREYVDKARKLIGKTWKAADLIVDDLVAFMEESVAKPKDTSEGK